MLRTDALTVSAVVERVLATLEDSTKIRSATRVAVDALRARLDADYGVLRTDLGLTGS